MKKLLKLFPAIALFIALTGIARAQVFTPSYWLKIGSNLYPIGNVASTTIGTSTANGAFNNLTISGTCAGCGVGAGSTTINGVSGPFTFSFVATSSPSSITTSSTNIFLNLLQYTSSSDITVSTTGTIIFANHNISQFTNNSGYGTSND
jgi:hypothetical protein